MARRIRRMAGGDSEIDLTPMLDVVFILLIFFIVTATFTRESGIDMRQPDSDAAEPPPNAPPVIVVQVDQNNRIYVNQLETDIERVSAAIERFRSDNPNSPVLVEAHADAHHGVIVRIRDQATLVGVEAVSIQIED